MELDRETGKLEVGQWGTLLAERMMHTERRPRREREAPKVRYVLRICLAACMYAPYVPYMTVCACLAPRLRLVGGCRTSLPCSASCLVLK